MDPQYRCRNNRPAEFIGVQDYKVRLLLADLYRFNGWRGKITKRYMIKRNLPNISKATAAEL